VYYYTGNHLSSTQLVTDGTGVAIQQVEYAPFGEVVNEYNIDWSSGQVPDFKFNGKELDEESGMYYFEARYQSPPVFISRDVMFEGKPWMSPHAYCSNSPVNRNDPSGMLDEPVFNSKGDFLGTTKEGYKGKVIIYDGPANFKDMTADELLNLTGGTVASTYDNARDNLSNDAKSKIWTHVVSQLGGTDIFDETFYKTDIDGWKIHYDDVSLTEKNNWGTTVNPMTSGLRRIVGNDKYGRNYETTVENLQATLVLHEWYSHVKKGYSDRTMDHSCAYEAVQKHSIYENTTDKYKRFIQTMLDYYIRVENERRNKVKQ
jgi:RHS repeat-associated protein